MSDSNGRPFRLVIFDWDGTLIDSIGAIVDCTRAVFAEFDQEPASEARVRALIGSGLAESIQTLAPSLDEAALRLAVDTYRRLWLGKYHRLSKLIPGAREVLDSLREEGYLLAVATAKARRGLDLDLDRLELDGPFDAGRTVDEAPSKPSPVMLIEILDELGVRRQDALMVGDSVHDVQMAHNAGVPVVAVASGAAPEEVLRAEEPMDCLESVRDLPDWLRTD